jgi:hypothetical protein
MDLSHLIPLKFSEELAAIKHIEYAMCGDCTLSCKGTDKHGVLNSLKIRGFELIDGVWYCKEHKDAHR